jgi:hypothetical protein
MIKDGFRDLDKLLAMLIDLRLHRGFERLYGSHTVSSASL